MTGTLSAFRSLSADQRVRFGTVAMLVGIVLIGVLGFASLPSVALQVVLGVIGVVVMVAGVLLVGTSEGTV
jgi:glucose uptake protein GlcU